MSLTLLVALAAVLRSAGGGPEHGRERRKGLQETRGFQGLRGCPGAGIAKS